MFDFERDSSRLVFGKPRTGERERGERGVYRRVDDKGSASE